MFGNDDHDDRNMWDINNPLSPRNYNGPFYNEKTATEMGLIEFVAMLVFLVIAVPILLINLCAGKPVPTVIKNTLGGLACGFGALCLVFFVLVLIGALFG